MIKKILTFVKEEIEKIYSVENKILPLLKTSESKIKLSINEACSFLNEEIKKVISEIYKDETEEKNKQQTETEEYYKKIKEETLYSIKNQSERITKATCLIAEKLLIMKSKELDVRKYYEALHLAIKERACVDDHERNINNVLIQLTYEQFEKPICNVLQYIYRKLTDKIRAHLELYDHYIFKGFYDTQTTHTWHITEILLDKLFNIAGGTLKDTKDILIPQTKIGTKIIEETFKNELTVKKLISEQDEDWRNILALELSCATQYKDGKPHTGQINLSTMDLSNAHEFIEFLVEKKLINEEEKKKIKNPDELEDEDWNFFKHLATISTEIGDEKQIYTPLFAQTIIEFIQEKIDKNNKNETNEKKEEKEEKKKEIEPHIETKILSLFNQANKNNNENIEKIRFTYEEIMETIEHEESEANTPFLKPYLHPIHLMIANCEPKDAKKIYLKWIEPNSKNKWVKDCLLMMACMNKEAFISLGKEVLTSEQFKCEKKGETILERLIKKNPEALSQYIKTEYITIDFIHENTKNKQFPLEFWLVQFKPKIVGLWIEEGWITLTELIRYKNKEGITPLEWLCHYGADIVDRLIEKKKIKSNNILRLVGKGGYTTLHWVAKYKGELIPKWLERGIIDTKDLINLKSSNKKSVLKILTEFNPDIVKSLLVKKIISIKTLEKDRAKKGATVIHTMGYFHPKKLKEWLDEDIISIEELIKIRNNDNETTIHTIAEVDASIITQLLQENKLSIKLLKNLKNNIDITPLHRIAEHHPKEINVIIDKEFTTVQELIRIKDNQKIRVIHKMTFKDKEILGKWIDEKKVTLKEYEECRDSLNNSLLHWMSAHCSEQLKKWIDEGKISLDYLLSIKGKGSLTIAHFLGEYNTDILEFWMEKGLITIDDLINQKTKEGITACHSIAQHNAETLLKWVETGKVSATKILKVGGFRAGNIESWLKKHNTQILKDLKNIESDEKKLKEAKRKRRTI